jgi:glucose/arabinose dehydrogenase
MSRTVRTKSVWPLLCTALCLALPACSGGGSTPTPTPTPPSGNRPPAFTSPATVSAAENSAGTVYTATASDPDGNPLTFSISGGADAAQLRITSTGALSFAAAPDFENPTDADHNNIYQITLAVGDGTTSTTLDLAVTIANVGPDGFRVARVATGFIGPVFLTAVPDGSGRVFVVERGGRIRILNPNTGAISAFLDITGQTTNDGERGLLSMAPAPDFATSGTFYVYMTNLAGDIEIRRYQTFPTQHDLANGATADAILTVPHPTNNNHNGGWLGFGPDGLLYIATGDGGSGGDPPNNAQNLNVLLGKMLRIDPSVDDFPTDVARDYRIPATNPFAASGGRPEIWAYGLRNPFRNSFDAATGNLWIADVGQDAREEVDVMRPQDGGANFGWRVMEGTAIYNGTPTAGMVPPVAEYLHGSGPRQGNSITGGYVYRGPVEALRGQYFFGDYVSGNIWSLPVAQVAIGQTIDSSRFILRRSDFAPSVGSLTNFASFGLDESGNLYIVDIGGDIFRIEAQ